jgi:hypothetical protein
MSKSAFVVIVLLLSCEAIAQAQDLQDLIGQLIGNPGTFERRASIFVCIGRNMLLAVIVTLAPSCIGNGHWHWITVSRMS